MGEITVEQTWHLALTSHPEFGREVICIESWSYGCSVISAMYYLEKGTVLVVEPDRSGLLNDKQEIIKTGYYILDTDTSLNGLLRYRMIDCIEYWAYPMLPNGKELNNYAHIIPQSELNKRMCQKIEICVKMMLNRQLSETDRKNISRWVEVYEADVGIVEYAIRSFGWWGNIRTTDIENKLKELKQAGITTVEEAKRFDANKQKSHIERYKKRLSARKSFSKEEERSEGN